MSISATIITLNEQDNIDKCLNSLKDLVEEIILVDSGSTDKTVEIAKKLKAKVYVRNFDNFANQKNYALSLVSNDWVFSIDADETVSKDLSDEIKIAVNDSKYDGFLIPRKNFILGKEIKYSRWSPDKHIWLWKKSKGQWKGQVHEEVVVNGKVGQLKNSKIHYQDKTIQEFINTNNHYSQIQAERLFKSNKRFSLLQLIWDPTFEFLLRFVYKRGFLDGWRGFVLAYLMGFYKASVLLKLLELEKNQKKI